MFEVRSQEKVKDLKGLEVKKLTGSRVKELMRINIVCIVFSLQLINSSTRKLLNFLVFKPSTLKRGFF